MRVERHLDKYNRRRSSRIILALAIVLLIVTVASLAWLFLSSQNKAKPKTSSPNQSLNNNAFSAKTPTKISGRYLFSGMVVIARATAYYANGDFNQPFSKLASFSPEKYDEWAVDLECPMTTKRQSFQYEVANTVFNCHPEFLTAMSKYFSIYALSNNHTADLGPTSMAETQKHLEDGGVQSYGNYDPSIVEDACSILAVKTHLIYPDGKADVATLPIAFCAWHYFERAPAPGEMEIMKQYAEIMPVWGFSQVGVEYRSSADERQIEIGHKLIDYGADFAIENSPHWVQQSEVYKGKPIFYSTGNFIFDQLDPETNRGVSIDVSMQIKYDENVGKWLELASTCNPKKLRDNCLEQARLRQLKKFLPEYRYEVIASKTGLRKITERGDDELQKAVEQRLDWTDTRAQLGQR